MSLARTSRLLLVLSLAACGGGGTDAATTGEGEVPTSGGDVAETETADADLDPSAPSEAPGDGEATNATTEAGDPGAETAATEPGDGGAATDPEEAWQEKVRLGGQWFRRRCDNCHPGGEEDIGPNLRGINWAVSRMERQIRRGSGRMRPIGPGRLSDENMDALMAYMSRFRAVRGVERPE